MTTTETDQAGSDTQSRGRLGAATERVRDGLGAARTKAGDAYSAARERTTSAAGAVRDRAGSAYGSARDTASRAGRRTAEGVETNPMAAVVGGLALGALLAAVLPKSRREEELLGEYGRRISDTAREAARAAREAGTSKLDELGLNRDTAKQKLGEIASSASEAAKTSATAAAQRIKGTQQAQ